MNDDAGKDEALLLLAQRIAEGSTVDPEQEQQRAAPDTDPATLKSLLELAAITAAHRDAERNFSAAPAQSLPAEKQWGHLVILEKIGDGQSSQVYRAYDSRLQTEVALKLSLETAGSVEAMRLMDEARLLAKVRHENVVRVHGADQRQGRVGIWMDLVQGRTLEEMTRTQGFSEREAVDVGIDLCRALAAIHRVGVLHGDIKAHNVVRQDGGRYVLVDLGAGRPLNVRPQAGHDVIGTPVYLAPEVLEGQPRSTASDIYSLGVLLFHLVTNDYPVYASNLGEFIDAHRSGSCKRLRDLRANLSDRFVGLVERAIAKDPKARFESAGSLEGALATLNAPLPVVVAPQVREAEEDPQKFKWKPWALAGSVAIVALGAGASVWLPRGQQRVASAAPTTSPATAADTKAPTVLAPSSYDIEAAFYRVRGDREERLDSASRLRVSDQLRMSVQTTSPAYIYVVNEDEKDNQFLLYPLPDQGPIQPVPANTAIRVPANDNWVVNSEGNKEHFVVFASTAPLQEFAELFKKLAAPQREDQASSSVHLPPDFIEKFRGVGKVVPAKPSTRFRDMFPTPLAGRETVQGMWVRQLTIANGGR